MNKLFVPLRGSNITCFSFSQNVIKTAFKKSLIYLVIFCFAFSPLFNIYKVFAQEVLIDQVVPNDTNLVQVNDQVAADSLPVDLLNDKPADFEKPDLPNGSTDENNSEVQNNNDPQNLIEPQQQSLSSNSSQGSNTEAANPPDAIRQNKPGVDVPTGALTYGYDLSVPDGRNGMTPQIGLAYNSQNTKEGSVFGYGWGINIPYIERLNKHGTNKLYSDDYYTTSVSGELAQNGSGKYIAKVESGDFLKYEKQGSGWAVVDKQGKKYFYGSGAQARQDDPNDSSKIYKWMLERVEDSNGNSINYFYTKDQGQIYPDYITYTDGLAPTGMYKIVFQKTSRTDMLDSHTTAFKVTTAYKISQIDIQTLGSLSGKYILNYTTGNNGARSILSSITETKYDKNNTPTTIPATSFNYTNSTGDLYTSSSSASINDLFPSNYINNGVITGDINGDSYTDLLQAYEVNQSTYSLLKNTYIYNPKIGKFESSSSYAPPTGIVNFTSMTYSATNGGTHLLDLGGDLKADILRLPYLYFYTQPNRENNNGNGWTHVPITSNQYYPSYSGDPWKSIFTQDFNGDGLVDIMQDSAYHYHNCGGACAWQGFYDTKTSLNNGDTFDKVTTEQHPGSGTTPYAYTPDFTGDNTHFMIDLNGDGLPDIVDAVAIHPTCGNCQTTYARKIYINNGNSWVLDNSYTLPSDFYYFYKSPTGNFTNRIEIADFNSDGLQDIIVISGQLLINKGKSFTVITLPSSVVYTFIDFLNSSHSNPYLMMDIDGDGDQDFVSNTTYSTYVQSRVLYNTLDKSNDIISRITLSSGGTSTINYKSSARYKDIQGNLLNPESPVNIQTVASITNNDGLGNNAVTSYEYSGGSYYYNGPDDRKFAGFSKVVQTNPDNTKQISYYNQGNATDTASGEYDDHVSKIGRTYRTDMFDMSNNLIKQETTKWEHSQVGTTNAYFVYPSQTISRIFTGINSYDTATGYDYNTNTGNLNSKTEYGTVMATSYQSFADTGTDLLKTEHTYTNCTSSGCLYLQLPNRVVVRDYTNNKIAEQKMYYDNASFGVATAGNNTKTENWISGTSYATTQKTYNLFGMPISVTDARSNTTNINYDVYNLYPSSVTNALSQTTGYVYDYNTGKVVRTVDANGMAAETDYDGFGRPTAERSSSDTSYSSLINTASYTYNDTMGAGGMVPYVQKTTNLSGALSGTTYSLLDGLGREVRNITQSGPASYVASDTVYDNMGRVIKKSLPYNFSGSPINYSGPTINNNIITTNTYDSLGRITTSTNTLGTNTNIYNLNTTTTIDPENHSKDVVTDAFGNIISVIEHNGASTYTTNYNWDGLGNLISLTDALGNVRTFTYDAQGNRLSATDLHAPTDTAYGSYTYSYDANNNLVQKNTPNGDVVRYIYDVLNRPTRESNNSVAQINYTYDSCANGIGKLCSVNRVGSSTKSFIYTNRGLLSSDTTILGTKNWLSSYAYNYAGNPIQITYPDNSSVRYTYDNRGLITQIEKQDTATGAWANVITNITYNPLGQKESVQYANGRTQNYTYDVAKQYQLTRNTLDAPIGYIYPNFIDTLYAFSPSGNLTQKTENFNLSNPQTFTYTYDDLSRLTGVTKTVNAPLTGYTESYTYNALGNIINKTGPGSYMYAGTNPGVYANPHAATSVGSINYGYDKNGNLTGWGTTPNNTALNYNYRNELTSYVKISAPAINNTYVYDYSGARIKTTTSAGITYSPSKYFDENATINKRYIYLNDQLVVTVEVSGTGSPIVNYIHPDYLGGTQMVTDSAGVIKKQDLEYYPFGEILANTKMGGFDEKHKYTGHEYDTDTGLNFMQARYQSGKEGRFWQQDPIIRELDNSKLETLLTDPQRWNSYVYASNNPLKFVDPDGRTSREALENRPLITLGLMFATYTGSRVIARLADSGVYGTFMPSNFINHSLSLNNNKAVTDPSTYSSNGNVLNRSFAPNSELSMKVGENKDFKKALSDSIAGKPVGSFQFDRTSDKDLGLSLQKTTISSLDIKNTKNGYDVNATLTDNFLFVFNSSKVSSKIPDTSLVGGMNNYAALMQDLGVISPYTSTINISRSYSKEELGITK